MPSSTTQKPRGAASARPRKKAKSLGRGGWIAFWPLLLCLAITPFAVRSASILALAGPRAFALLYPWVEVVRSPALHIPSAAVGPLSQYLIFLQFPLYGLLMTLLYKADKPQRTVILAVLMHFGGLALAVGLAYLAAGA